MDSYTKLLDTTKDVLCDREVLIVNKYTMMSTQHRISKAIQVTTYMKT